MLGVELGIFGYCSFVLDDFPIIYLIHISNLRNTCLDNDGRSIEAHAHEHPR